MTYVAPTFTSFLLRFPEFQGMPSDVITAVLDEALAETDETWGDADRQTAGLYLTAHMLSIEGWPGRITGNASAAETATTGRVLREKVGDVEVQYGAAETAASFEAGLRSTPYGARYLALLRRNSPAVFVI